MALSPEMQVAYDDFVKNLRTMRLEDLEDLQKALIRHGTSSSAVRAYPITELYKKAQDTGATKYAEMSLADIENQRKILESDRSFAEQQRQFDLQNKRADDVYNLQLKALQDEEDAKSKANRDWWKPFLGTLAGTALGGGVNKLLYSTPKKPTTPYVPGIGGSGDTFSYSPYINRPLDYSKYVSDDKYSMDYLIPEYLRR